MRGKYEDGYKLDDFNIYVTWASIPPDMIQSPPTFG